MPEKKSKYLITVRGLVQGVGFRPFVSGLAKRLHLPGLVLNAGGFVQIFLLSTEEDLSLFLQRLEEDKPDPAKLDEVTVELLELDHPLSRQLTEKSDFCIAPSLAAGIEVPFLPADRVTCPDCLSDLKDQDDPRYRYPFISCTTCGPRYSIMTGLPYDRERTTMRGFSLCGGCRSDYADSPRRCHAQTLACPLCGPHLTLYARRQREEAVGISAEVSTCERLAEGEAALQAAIAYLKAGQLVAVKGIGGYQLFCRADHSEAVARLRLLKNREAKPFAVMFKNLNMLRQYQPLTPAEELALSSPAGPIVLLKKPSPDRDRQMWPAIVADVCGDSPYLGAFLPTSGLHQLLLDELGMAVVTSANLTDSPLIIEDDSMLEFLADRTELKAVLSHDRQIVTPLDDSVSFVADERFHLIRRARGYVPNPLILKLPPESTLAVPSGRAVATCQAAQTSADRDLALLRSLPTAVELVATMSGKNSEVLRTGGPQDLLAVGADLKATSGLLRGNSFYLTQPVGDLIQLQNIRVYRKTRDHMAGLLNFKPQALVLDGHPGYQSRQQAVNDPMLGRLPRLEIQHHHAHIASVMAEHGLSACLGFAFDGTGYGPGGAVWGGEVLFCSGSTCLRLGSLEPIAALGGDRMAKDAGLMFYNYLLSDRTGRLAAVLPEPAREKVDRETVLLWKKARTAGFPMVSTTSTGRLFDAAAFALGLGRYNRFEGDLPGQLEALAWCAEQSEVKLHSGPVAEVKARLKLISNSPAGDGAHLPLSLNPIELLLKLCQGIQMRHDPAELAWAFHERLADYIVSACLQLESVLGHKTIVALSGGCFHNRLLLQLTQEKLKAAGFISYSNEQVPAGDGGLALGQAYLGRLCFNIDSGEGETHICV